MEYVVELVGDVIYDPLTGLEYMMSPSDEERARGVIPYQLEIHRWIYIRVGGLVCAVSPYYIDWDSDIEECNPNEMGQWPFGFWATEEERIEQEAIDCLDLLLHHLEDELEEMDRLEDMMNEAENDDDNDSDEDPLSEDEGYVTTDEVDFEARDFWVFGLNPVLGRIQL